MNVLLISLKAGGVALNLTAANHIFLMDPWWNPAAEMQVRLCMCVHECVCFICPAAATHCKAGSHEQAINASKQYTLFDDVMHVS
jgi:hypothetical protein